MKLSSFDGAWYTEYHVTGRWGNIWNWLLLFGMFFHLPKWQNHKHATFCPLSHDKFKSQWRNKVMGNFTSSQWSLTTFPSTIGSKQELIPIEKSCNSLLGNCQGPRNPDGCLVGNYAISEWHGFSPHSKFEMAVRLSVNFISLVTACVGLWKEEP